MEKGRHTGRETSHILRHGGDSILDSMFTAPAVVLAVLCYGSVSSCVHELLTAVGGCLPFYDTYPKD